MAAILSVREDAERMNRASPGARRQLRTDQSGGAAGGIALLVVNGEKAPVRRLVGSDFAGAQVGRRGCAPGASD